MRIIFFNIWHGHVWEKLQPFLNQEKETTDIFCLLEVNPDLQIKLEKDFSKYNHFYYKGIKNVDDLYEGRSIFVKKESRFLKKVILNPFDRKNDDTGGISFAEIAIKNQTLNLALVHGKSRPGTKFDTPERIDQSQKIINVMLKKVGPKIIGGDFNLMPNTESIKMFENCGYKNLITEFNIKRTRNRLAWKQFNTGLGFVKQYFADYCFVSPEIKVINFQVPSIEASDHEPLILDFEI